MTAPRPLIERIKRQIEQDGPLSVAQYMSICLCDAQAGYYTTARPFGREGDFVTAPEISQMIGELIGVWCQQMWQALGSPKIFNLVELGPGRGTLMADLLRSTSKASAFSAALRIHLLEISEQLQNQQKKTLASFQGQVEWIDSLDAVKGVPSIFIANEFLDALPFHQYVKIGENWLQRMVGVDGGKLAFKTGLAMTDPAEMPDNHADMPDGTIFELSPAREAIVMAMADRIISDGGAALLVDYGNLAPGFGDTLQAVSDHQYADPLVNPGKVDLTSHVDFAALVCQAKLRGVQALTTTQGDFLLRMGLVERAGALGASQPASGREAISQAVERLAGDKQMGQLFKVLALAPPGLPVAGFS